MIGLVTDKSVSLKMGNAGTQTLCTGCAKRGKGQDILSQKKETKGDSFSLVYIVGCSSPLFIFAHPPCLHALVCK